VDTHWLELKTDIIPTGIAGVATFLVTWGFSGANPSEFGLPILAGLIAVIVYFVLANSAEFIWHFAVAGYRNEIDDLRAGVSDSNQLAPLRVRYEQREPYTAGRFPGGPLDVHSVGIHNPPNNPTATHVRVEVLGMDPPPRNPRGSPPSFPAIVPMGAGGDPRVGITLNSDREELWTVATVSRDGGGNLFVQGIAPTYWPMGSGAMWDFQPDERWRLRYQVSADNFPPTFFTVVIAVAEGVIRCRLEGG